MSSHGDQIKSALGISALISLYGVASLVVIFLGPQFGVGYMWQAVIIGLLLLTWPFALVINRVRKNRAERAEQAAAGASAAPAPSADGKAPKVQKGKTQLPPVAGTYEALTRGAAEVVQWLRGTKLSGKGKAADAVYALPWFVIAGPSTSGKTSLLQSSALDFHTLPSQRAADMNVIRPTANCDWRVTDSAIWLDTTGRYQTEGPDRDEWAALIETIKSYRKARPLDGLVIAVNTSAVLRWNENEIEQQAKILRARLDEARLRAGIRFPVYLVFTHADAIEGFSDFFRSFQNEERTQVWGVTFPLAQAQQAHALFDDAFDHLYGRLTRRRSVQLATTMRPDEQLRIFKFPGRFRRARGRLGLFTSALFRPNPFSESPMLRGFYFTSSTGQGAVNARYLDGHELFTQVFFHEVLLRDRDIVASMQAQKAHPTRLRNVLIGLAAMLLLVFFLGMVVSFFKNKALIADAQARGSELNQIRKITSKNFDEPEAARKELTAMENLREVLSQLDEYDRTSPPLSLRFGLYSGGKLNAEGESDLRHIYFEAVEQRFLKPTLEKMKEDLRSFASGAKRTGAAPATTGGATTPSTSATSTASTTASADPASLDEEYLGRHYDLLKAYLMLSQPDKVEPSFLENQLRDYWKQFAPAGREEEALQQLAFYSTQASKSDVSHFEPDAALVSQAQAKLTAYPIISRVYKRIISDINKDVKFPVNLTTIPGAREGNVLISSYSVPPSYTIDGYKKWSDTLESSAAEQFRRDDWVMKGTEASDSSLDVKKDELQNIYYRDYIAQWQRFLQEIKVRDYRSKEEAVRTLRTLAGSTSPLDAVMREVARQTNLSGGGGGIFGWITGLFKSKTGEAGSSQVEREFNPLIQFVGGKEEKLTEYRTKLNAVTDGLRNNPKSLSELSKQMQAGDDRIGLRAARQAVGDLLEAKGFGASPGSEAASKVLRQPLDNLNTLLVGTDFEQIDKVWQQLYARSWQPLEASFPFTEGAAGDASVAALTNFLNPENGELTRFFNERLKPYFEEDWSPKKEAADKFTPEFAAFLKNARRLRDALFPGGGRTPAVEYQIALTPVASASSRVEIDGNLLEQDKPAPPFRWPGNRSGAKVSVTMTGGASSGQTLEKSYPGEWGLLKMFVEGGGGDGKAAQFNLQLNMSGTSSATASAPAPLGAPTAAPAAAAPAASLSVPVRISIQPKSGTIFQRELFTTLRAPKRLVQQQTP
ncbi:MAG TPA: type VI secretion system membrane subunit TssM [Pyrinomonadaceae bacterium]|jgi:type VI secretion system protein ImpL